MAAVVLDMSMSLDGFVTGPDPRPGLPLGEDGDRLHDWMFSGRRNPAEADPEPPSTGPPLAMQDGVSSG